MSSIFDGEDTVVGLLWLVSEIGAVAWGLWHFVDINLVLEVASVAGSSSGIIETALFGLITVAGALALADSLGAYDMQDVVGDLY